MSVHFMSCGNLKRYLVGCHCGRGFEMDTLPAAVPAHVHNEPKD